MVLDSGIGLAHSCQRAVSAGTAFGRARAAELGIVTRVVPDRELLATATATAEQLAAKPAGALQASKRLLKRAARQQLEQAMRIENEVFSRPGAIGGRQGSKCRRSSRRGRRTSSKSQRPATAR